MSERERKKDRDRLFWWFREDTEGHWKHTPCTLATGSCWVHILRKPHWKLTVIHSKGQLHKHSGSVCWVLCRRSHLFTLYRLNWPLRRDMLMHTFRMTYTSQSIKGTGHPTPNYDISSHNAVRNYLDSATISVLLTVYSSTLYLKS